MAKSRDELRVALTNLQRSVGEAFKEPLRLKVLKDYCSKRIDDLQREAIDSVMRKYGPQDLKNILSLLSEENRVERAEPTVTTKREISRKKTK